MSTEKETAKQIALRKELASINRSLGADGVLLLIFSHTDDKKELQLQSAGTIPALPDVLSALAQYMAITCYDMGKRDALAGVKSNLDDSKL